MGRVGKISTIKKEYSRSSGSLESSLALNGYMRFPGTGIRIAGPFKEANGNFRTGLDENAIYLNKLSPEDKKIEQERLKALREELEAATGLDLSPKGVYYTKMHDETQQFKADIVKLKEGDNMFNLDDPFQAITFAWLRVHPLIANSYQAWERGEYPSTTQFYVNDDNIEAEVTYKKKTLINKAVATLEILSLEKRKKVARLLGLPVTESSKENLVYNLLDSFIKQAEVKEGEHRGTNPVNLFMRMAQLEDSILHVRDLVEQGITHSVLRVKTGKVYDGQVEVAKSKDDYIADLLKDKNQEDLLALEEKVKSKKSLLTN